MTKPLLLYNLRLPLTPEFKHPAILIEKGAIQQINEYNAIRSDLPANTEKLDLQGQTVLPGLTDFHLHLHYLADRLDAVDCETGSLEEVLSRVAQRTAITPPGEWIIGYGWNQNDWQPPHYGSAAQLDAISQAHPILLHAKSLHAAWANSLAFELAGIRATTPDPDKGVFLRNEDGSPNGILLEYAIPMLEEHIPQPTTEEVSRKVLLAQEHLHSLGITGVHDFDRFEAAEALLTLVERDLLRLRVSQNLPSEQLDRVLDETWRAKLNRPPFLKPGWLKLFADGALGPQSAAMLQPYEKSQERGMLLLSARQLADLGMAASRQGWPLAIHAIGDRAVREVLDGIELLGEFEARNNLPHLPHRIEHIQLIHPTDLLRMKQLNVVASVQPTHATSDMLTAEHHWGLRCEFAYAYQSMLDHGLTMRFGSDAPVENANPFEGLFAATTRQRKDGSPGKDGWYPKQRVQLEQAIHAFTTPLSSNAAASCPKPLSPGSHADLIVLEDDPFRLASHEIRVLKPTFTIIAGEIVFSRGGNNGNH